MSNDRSRMLGVLYVSLSILSPGAHLVRYPDLVTTLRDSGGIPCTPGTAASGLTRMLAGPDRRKSMRNYGHFSGECNLGNFISTEVSPLTESLVVSSQENYILRGLACCLCVCVCVCMCMCVCVCVCVCVTLCACVSLRPVRYLGRILAVLWLMFR